MRVFYGFDALPRFREPAVTVGSFDGVHLGHQALLARLCEEARATGGESIVLTFDPHPRITLGRTDGFRQLTTLDEKLALLERLGIDDVIVIPFDSAFSALSGREFIERYLKGRIGTRTLVVGYNHRFGHDKEGDYRLPYGSGLRTEDCPGGRARSGGTPRQLDGHPAAARRGRYGRGGAAARTSGTGYAAPRTKAVGTEPAGDTFLRKTNNTR